MRPRTARDIALLYGGARWLDEVAGLLEALERDGLVTVDEDGAWRRVPADATPAPAPTSKPKWWPDNPSVRAAGVLSAVVAGAWTACFVVLFGWAAYYIFRDNTDSLGDDVGGAIGWAILVYGTPFLAFSLWVVWLIRRAMTERRSTGALFVLALLDSAGAIVGTIFSTIALRDQPMSPFWVTVWGLQVTALVTAVVLIVTSWPRSLTR